MVSIFKIKLGHNSVNNVGGVTAPVLFTSFSAHPLMIIHIVTVFQEHVLNDFKVIERKRFPV